jgi:hypothetical protein
MSEEEWGYCSELREVLKVSKKKVCGVAIAALQFVPRHMPRQMEADTDIGFLGIQGRNTVFLAIKPKPPHCNPSNGLY